MLAGLQAAAVALNNGQGIAAINRNNLNVSSAKSRFSADETGRSPVFEGLSPRREAQGRAIPSDLLGYSDNQRGTFHKDYNGDIVDPTGKTLFNGVPDGISVGDDGVVYEFNEPIGKIEVYNGVGEPIQLAAQSVIASRIGFADLTTANNAVNSKMEQRAFWTNAVAVGVLSSEIGSKLNMMG